MKIAIVGTSNIGALKFAEDRISAAYPEASLSFFGLPGARFAKVSSRKGVFGPRRAETEIVRLAKAINGVPRLDLTKFDRILVIADTLGLNGVLWLASQYDVADWATRRDLPLLSEAAMADAIRTNATDSCDRLRQQFLDLPVHVATAPYPTTRVIAPGKTHRHIFAKAAENPEAPRLERLFQAALAEALQERGFIYVAQPEETIAQPFFSHEHYGEGALDFRKSGVALDDHRHLNADFGTSLFHAFAVAVGLQRAAPQNQEG